MTVPVTLLTGFLGAGKTTLLNHLLSGDHGRRLVIVVNDFGAINIDARLIKHVEGDTIALTNGCICCDRRANLRLTVQDLLSRPVPPEYVVVEASGIADPLALAAAFRTRELQDEARLDGIITVVDAANARDSRLDAQLVRDQIVAADLVVLNKIDLVSAEERAGLKEWVTGINQRARILEAVRCRVPTALVLGLEGGRPELPAPHPGPDGGHGFTSWTYSQEMPVHLHPLIEALKNLPPTVFRVKGIVQLAEAPGLRIALHMVGRRIDTEILGRWEGDRPYTRLVLIGMAPGPEPEDLNRQFDTCGSQEPRILTARAATNATMRSEASD